MKLPTVLSLTLVSAISGLDPFTHGPHEVDHTHIDAEFLGVLDHRLDIFTPRSEGTYPLIVFFPGLACTTDASEYSDVLSHIASWGYAVIGPWALLYNPADTYEAKWVDVVLGWCREHLDPASAQRPYTNIAPGVIIDFDTMYLGGQSSGNHVAVNYLALREEQDCSHVHGLFMMSPVDGMDPYGIVQEYCIHPPAKLNFNIPAMIISGGMDGVAGVDNLGGLFPPCAPDELANRRFYDALTGPTIIVNTTQYGHIDVFNEGFYSTAADLHLCATNRDLDRGIYRTFLAGEVIAFLNYFTHGECEMLDYLTRIADDNIAGYVETKGGVESFCGQDQCIWSEGPMDFIKL